jgi:hypothetical protein
MFLSILKWGVISLTIIYLIHHFYIFFLNTLTVPKIKDLVNKPNEQYDEMFKTLQGSTMSNSTRNDMLSKNKNDTINEDKMNEELSSFLNELKKNPESDTMINDISTHMNSNNNSNNNILGANEVDSYSAF